MIMYLCVVKYKYQFMNNLRKVLLLVCVFLVCASAYSQNILQAASNDLRHGDVLYKQTIEFDSGCLQHDGFVLDLNDAEFGGKKFRQSIMPVAYGDTVYSLESGSRTYFLLRNDSLLRTRDENNLEYIDYDMPEAWLRFPFKKGDAVSGYFHGVGIYCDKLVMRKFGSYFTSAVSLGKIVLPDGGVLPDCLCLHTLRNFSFITYPTDSIHAVLPVFTSDSIVARCSSLPSAVREETYRIYALGYRYPIIEISDLYDGNNCIVSHSSCYYSPVDQTMLYDMENSKTRSAMVCKTDGGEDSDDVTGNTPKYAVVHNSEEQKLTVTIDSNGSGNITAELIICDISGIVYRKQSLSCASDECQSVELSCSGLRCGEYALRIYISDGNDYSEKFFVR